MYTRQEATRLRQQFWTTFGQYLSPVPSANGEKINWINYKTGVRYISFKMDADERSAYIAIEISHPDVAQRNLYYDHFQSLKKVLQQQLQGDWVWETDDVTNRIYSRLPANIFNKEEWPAIISFFKSGITGIDRFWAQYKDIFEMLS